MKKVLSVLIFTSFFWGCKKDRTCECVLSPDGETFKVTIKSVSKKTAKDICVSRSYNEVEYDYSTYPPTTTTVLVTESCSLK